MVCWRNKVECQKPHKCPSQKASVCKCKELLTPLGHGAWQWEAVSIYPALLEEKNSILNSVHLLLQRAFSFTVQQLASEHNCDLLEVKHPEQVAAVWQACLKALCTPLGAVTATPHPMGAKHSFLSAHPSMKAENFHSHFHPSKLTLPVHSEQLLPNPIAVGWAEI